MYKVWQVMLVLSILVWVGCSKNSSEPQGFFIEDTPTFLLGLDSDPAGLESEPALAHGGIGRILEALDLSDAQRAAVDTIREAYVAQFRALRDEWHNGTSWEEIRARREALHTQMLAEIEAVLSDAQRTLLNEIRTALANGEMPDVMIDVRVDRLDDVLSFSEGQRTAVWDLMRAAADEVSALRQSSSDRRAFREAIHAILETLHDDIRALLTAEQQALFDEMVINHHPHRRGRMHGGR